MERRCLTCNVPNLFKKQCLDSLHHKDSQMVLLYRDRSSAKFVALRPLPQNKHNMKSKSMKYSCNHTESDCRYGNNICIFPHTELEEEVWNVLLSLLEMSPAPELPDRTSDATEVSTLLTCSISLLVR